MLFGKKKESTEKQPNEKQLEEIRKKEDTNRIIGEVEQLAPGQSLIYQLPELYWNGFAAFITTELNPSYPKKGKKYIIFRDKIADGKPAGNKNRYFESNNPKSIAEDLLSRHAQRFIEPVSGRL